MNSKKRVEDNKLPITSRILLGLVLLGILSAMYTDHYKNFKTRLNLQNVMENPEKHSGVYYQTMGRVTNVNNDFFYLLDTESNKEVPVFYPDHPVLEGDHLVAYGPFTSEGYMIAANIRFQNSEPFKYIISGISSLYIAWLFFKEWKVTKYGFEAKVN